MGVHPDYTPGEDCLACYPANLTPMFLWFEVTGIQKGDGWNPGDGEPANGNHMMTQFVGFPCYWKVDLPLIPPIRVYYAASAIGGTILQISNLQFYKEFLGVECVKEGNSQYTNGPFTRFFGGHAIIYDTFGGDLADFHEVANQIGVPIVPELRFERFPIPPDFNVYRLAGCFGKTNIKVKKEIP